MAVNDIVMGAAGASGPATFVEDVFSTYLYTGNVSTQTITNGIDLSNKGGMVWTKSRSAVQVARIYDSARGTNKNLIPSLTNAEATDSPSAMNFSSSGFGLVADNSNNQSGVTYASWTFREQPKFFDIVTYTGDGVDNRSIPHSLGSVPGCMILKATVSTINLNSWAVYHRSLPAPPDNYMILNATSAYQTYSGFWGTTGPDASNFYIDAAFNESGKTYIVYLFAHDAGGFGTSGADNVISCGSFTSAYLAYPNINLGYEPQWVLIKRTDIAQDWYVMDNMRPDFTANAASGNVDTKVLRPNTSGAESGGFPYFGPNATGFGGVINFSSGTTGTYIYIAIRRPMKTPTTGTSVFSPQTYTSTDVEPRTITTGFVTDTVLYKPRTSNGGMDYKWRMSDRLRGVGVVGTNSGSELSTNDINSENYTNSVTAYNSSFQSLALMNGVTIGYLLNRTDDGGNVDYVGYNFKRAPGFFDVVCYTGTGATNRQVNHNLGVKPELVIYKPRNNSGNWVVFTNYDYEMYLNTTTALQGPGYEGNHGNPTSTYLVAQGGSNTNGYTFVAYLFATVANVSKVGSYTGTGATQTIDAGLASGARFVMIKRTDSAGNWFVWDTARGMVAGTDPRLAPNLTSAESNANWVYTASTGFQIVTTDATVNASGGTYIYLAIA